MLIDWRVHFRQSNTIKVLLQPCICDHREVIVTKFIKNLLEVYSIIDMYCNNNNDDGVPEFWKFLCFLGDPKFRIILATLIAMVRN